MTPSCILCVTVRFLQPTFHGRIDGGEGEWPPSPLRLFQALVASAARLPIGLDDRTREAFHWLERCSAPIILAPPAMETTGRDSVATRIVVIYRPSSWIGREWAAVRCAFCFSPELELNAVVPEPALKTPSTPVRWSPSTPA